MAIITPFNSDYSIDFSTLGRITEHVIEGGVNYVVALGSTAECTTLSIEEKQAVISFLSDTINKRVPLVVGFGGCNTQEVVSLLRQSDLSGVDAILSVAPYYNKPTQNGLFLHFKTIAEASNLPVILYNIPGRTGCNILPDTIIRLARTCKNIMGVKEASGNILQIMNLINHKPDNFMVISGDDMLSIPIISLGGSGVISVLANAYPSETTEIIAQALKNNYKSSRELQYKFMELVQLLFVEGNPSGIKALMNIKGLCNNILRLPLTPVSGTTFAKMKQFVEKYKSL